MTRGEVEIRQKMTVEELAQAMGKDIGESLLWGLKQQHLSHPFHQQERQRCLQWP